jgi:hypothetical protein
MINDIGASARILQGPVTPLRVRARAFVTHSVIPTIAAAFGTHPELDFPEILQLCETALVNDLTLEMKCCIDEVHNRLFRPGE